MMKEEPLREQGLSFCHFIRRIHFIFPKMLFIQIASCILTE